MQNFIVYCADIGSIKNKRFGWCRGLKIEDKFEVITGTDIGEFAEEISDDLSAGKKVALGFECPLFVPIPDNPALLTSARQGEADRAWSAGAGCGALATGLTECVWILNKVKELSQVKILPTFDWDEFNKGLWNLFIWEAFVTKGSKAKTHSGDAKVAMRAFWRGYPDIVQANSVIAENPYNLVAAALLRVGLTDNINFLSESCIVIKG